MLVMGCGDARRDGHRLGPVTRRRRRDGLRRRPRPAGPGARLRRNAGTLLPADLAATVHDATSGYGVDVALELTGAPTAFEAVLPLGARIGGTVILVGSVFPTRAVPIAPEQIVRRCLTVRGMHNYAPRHLGAALEFLAANPALPFRRARRRLAAAGATDSSMARRIRGLALFASASGPEIRDGPGFVTVGYSRSASRKRSHRGRASVPSRSSRTRSGTSGPRKFPCPAPGHGHEVTSTPAFFKASANPRTG